MQDDLLQAVQEATEDEYELLGKLGGAAGRMAYLARERSTGDLVALVLQEDDASDGGEQFDLSVVRELDDSVPVAGHACHRCGAPFDSWSRFCDVCDRDVSGVASDEAVPGVSRGVLLDEVRSATDGEYEVLGSMERADGGGAVYFARELATGRLAGLSLQREDGPAGDEFTLVVSWLEPGDAPDAREAPYGPEPFEAEIPASDPGERVYAPYEPFAAPVEEAPVRWRPPGGRTDRRRLLAVAGVGVAVVLGGGLLFAMLNDGDEPAVPVAVADSAARPSDSVPSDSPSALSADPRSAAGSPGATASTEPPSRPAPAPAAKRTEPGPEERPDPPPPEARSARSVETAVRRFAQAVQSGDAGRIRSAYPDITDGELSRWRDHLGAGGEVGYSMQTEPEISGSTAEAVFVLTVRPYGGVPVPMTFRGIFERRNGGWRLKEVRSLGGF
ncbi:MAG TPA: hypothetical protein VHG28_22965 [Longimicrobiaceae bacterium]|nr:hypothetical protein [Longimicrobiaceae bacterium]